MASFNCGEGEARRFNLAHHHQLTYEPILHHHDRLTNRFQVIKGHFSGELRRCYRAPVGFVFLWPFTALAGQWRRQTDSPAQCAVVIGFMGPCGDRRQQFSPLRALWCPAGGGTDVTAGRRLCHGPCGAAGGQQRQKAGCCEGAMQSLLAGRLPFRVVVMIVVDMISIGLTPSNRIMSILPSSAGADGGLSW